MFEVKIRTESAAFKSGADSPEMDEIITAEELAMMLNKIAWNMYNGDREGSVIDTNGNKVGEWRLD